MKSTRWYLLVTALGSGCASSPTATADDDTSTTAADTSTTTVGVSSEGSTSTSDAGDTSTSSTTTGDVPDTSSDGGTGLGICGDGIVGGDEECDDGNFEVGDGCTPECIDEPGWFAQLDAGREGIAAFASIAVADDGSVIAVGTELVVGVDDTIAPIARFAADGTLLGESRLELDVATAAFSVAAHPSGDALVALIAGPEFGPMSLPSLVRITPGESEPVWATQLWLNGFGRPPSAIVRRSDGVTVVPISGLVDDVREHHLIAVDDDGEIVWDREMSVPEGTSQRCLVLQDGVELAAVCIGETDGTAEVDYSRIAIDGSAELLDTWTLGGRVRGVSVQSAAVVLAGSTADDRPVLSQWEGGVQAWSIERDDEGAFYSVAHDDDGTIVATGTVTLPDQFEQALVYVELASDGSVLVEPEPRADHYGRAIARNDGVSFLGGAVDTEVLTIDDLQFQLTAAWVQATSG